MTTKYERLVAAHEAIGSHVTRSTMGDRPTIYVEAVINGNRFAPDGLVLSKNKKLAAKQATEYLELTLEPMKRSLGK